MNSLFIPKNVLESLSINIHTFNSPPLFIMEDYTGCSKCVCLYGAGLLQVSGVLCHGVGTVITF